MSKLLRCSFLLAVLVAVSAQAVGPEGPRAAVAVLVPRAILSTEPSSIVGTVVFTETDNGLRLTGTISGMPSGKYGFHVHERGDITTCDSTLSHFNPEVTNHGGRTHAVRHVGDLGNIEFTTNGVATIDITDNVLTLRGRNNVVGRALVLHAQEDDEGLGGHELSLTTGNAGARIACGVIGIMSPLEPWNAVGSAAASSPSLIIFIAATLFVYLRS